MTRRPHVLMTTDAVGGVFTYAVDAAAGLHRSGIRVTLALLGPAPDRTRREALRALPGVETVETGLALDWLAPDEAAVERSSAALAVSAGRIGADLVHLNAAAQAAAGGFPCPVIVGHHSCLATWWRAVRGAAPMPVDFARRTEWTARGLAGADAVVAPTEAFATETAVVYGIDRPLHLRNGRTRLPGGAVRASDREDFALAAGRLWDEAKNARVLDRAAARLGRPVLAAGPLRGPNGAAFIPERLLSTGTLDETGLADLMRRAAVFVSAARYEPFGLTALEAAQTGCPLVLSDIPTHRELWDGAALFVSPDDVDGFAAAMRSVIDRPGLRADLAAAARERAARFSADAMVRRLIGLYAAFLDTPALREATA